MIKYIVYWVVSTTQCADLSKDEFGRTRGIVPAVCIMETTVEDKVKEFQNKEDAFEFYNSAKEQEGVKDDGYFGGTNSVITKVRIDSLMQ